MGAVRRFVIAGVAAVGFAMAAAVPAVANGPHDNESDEPRALVLQAISLIVNTPDEVHEIEERLEHALEAPHTEGVDLTLVEEAAAALEDHDLRRTRELLETSIGAGPFVGHGVPRPIRELSEDPDQPGFAIGGETGTTVVLDEYRAEAALDGGEVALLIVSAAGITLGGLLAWRFRPADTVRQLRRARVG